MLLATLIASVSLGTVAAGVGGYGFTQARKVHVERRTISSPKIPKSFDGTRVVFVTDVHAGPYFGPAQMSALVDQVNVEDPDLILLGGDNVGGGRGSGISTFYPAAKDFRARLGKYAVLGNHDVWEGEQQARSGLTEAGFKLLDNESVAVERNGERIYLSGVEDLYTGDPDIQAAARGVGDGYSILLAHNPDFFAWSLPDERGVWDLALAGHTHGGQLTFFGKYAPILPSDFGNRYRTGWRTEQGTKILVSNGVGTVTAPVRLAAPPQIHVIELRHSDRATLSPRVAPQPTPAN